MSVTAERRKARPGSEVEHGVLDVLGEAPHAAQALAGPHVRERIGDPLLATAERSSLRELRDKCAQTKAAVTDMAERERRIHEQRCVRRYTDRDGAEHLHAMGNKREMALIDQALKPFVDRRFKQARADGVREPLEAYAFDALVDLCTESVDGSAAAVR